MMFWSWFLYISGLSPGVVVSKLRWRLSFNGSFGVVRSFSGEVTVGTKSFIAFGSFALKVWYNVVGVGDVIKGDEGCAGHSAGHNA